MPVTDDVVRTMLTTDPAPPPTLHGPSAHVRPWRPGGLPRATRRVACARTRVAGIAIVGAGGSFATMKREPDPPADAVHDAVVAMGNASAEHGWSATVEHLRRAGARAREALATGDVDRVVDLRPTLPFGTSLRTFVATRVVELVVHGDDLAVSVGLDGLAPADAAFRVASELLVATAATQHDPLVVLRALARRERAVEVAFPVF